MQNSVFSYFISFLVLRNFLAACHLRLHVSLTVTPQLSPPGATVSKKILDRCDMIK